MIVKIVSDRWSNEQPFHNFNASRRAGQQQSPQPVRKHRLLVPLRSAQRDDGTGMLGRIG
jgi:hypothetical protein